MPKSLTRPCISKRSSPLSPNTAARKPPVLSRALEERMHIMFGQMIVAVQMPRCDLHLAEYIILDTDIRFTHQCAALVVVRHQNTQNLLIDRADNRVVAASVVICVMKGDQLFPRRFNGWGAGEGILRRPLLAGDRQFCSSFSHSSLLILHDYHLVICACYTKIT